MRPSALPWDYLIVTASNEAQARAYESQLRLRQRLGLLQAFGQVLVVADPEGKRVGSGGSTLVCLMEVVNRELAAPKRPPDTSLHQPALTDPNAVVESVLSRLRILIVHAGGDSRRLPAYSPCGKIFIPVPGKNPHPFGLALFDRIVPAFADLPAHHGGAGQVVVTAGDALILFDPSNITLDRPGLTALTCPDTPEQASKHGVFCAHPSGQVRLYLQKPSPAAQSQGGAIQPDGRTLLDIGIMSFDVPMAMALFRAFGIQAGPDGVWAWPETTRKAMLTLGVDFFREICCALGTDATPEHHRLQAQTAGSAWDQAGLRTIYEAIHPVPFHLQTIAQARFLHFGTTRQLITSGLELRQHDGDTRSSDTRLTLNNQIDPNAEIIGHHAWIEGCRIRSRLDLGGHNAVIGIDVNEPLSLPEKACLDILGGVSRTRQQVWFIRCYGLGDTFKDPMAKGGTFCGRPMEEWLTQAGILPEEIWETTLPEARRSLWDARVFPAISDAGDYRSWLWMYAPDQATPAQKRAFLDADRYSAAEIAVLAEPPAFFSRRQDPGLQKA